MMGSGTMEAAERAPSNGGRGGENRDASIRLILTAAFLLFVTAAPTVDLGTREWLR
jgi:hypothetical protein